MDTKKLRQKILDLAIHGKLVPQDPNDEPASVLLERIKAEKERLIKEGKIKRSKKTNNASDTPHYENVPFEVPDNWAWTTLGSISNYGTSINVQVGDIDSNEWILELEDIEKDTAKIIQHLSKKERFLNGTRHKFQKGDILYSKLRTYLNKVLVASNGGFCSTEIMPFGTYGILSNEYICHVLRSNHFLDYTLRCGYGVKMPRLSTNDACKGMIPLPPLAEQQRIVTEIEKWFALIDQIEQGKDDLLSIVKQTKSKILDLAIHGELVTQDPNEEPAIELLKRINPNFTPCDNGQYGKRPFEIPNSWCWSRLGDINNIARGGSPRPIKDYLTDDKNGINWIKIGDTTREGKYIDSVKEKIRPEGMKKSRFVHKGDFLLTNSMSFGRPYILNVDGCIHDGWLVISPIGEVYTSDFLYHLLSSSFAFEQFTNVASGGVVTNLNSDKVADTIFPVPPLAEQQRIVEKIEKLFEQLDYIENSLEA
ncbi:MAG TPA: restriction endonuclease subunit S [Bacteroidetes bacterium]|nr:restriction endonuclease subunit S [Candidatus Limimorpha avicola]